MDDDKTMLNYYFHNESNSLLYEVIVSIFLGVIFSRWSMGIIYLTLYIIVYEWMFCNFGKHHWVWNNRPFVICSSYFGWIIGRASLNMTVIDDNIPSVSNIMDVIYKSI